MDGPITTLLTLAAILIGFVAVTYLPPVALKRVQRRRLQARCQGRLSLTYDDGPDPKLTPELADLLRRHGAKASFFLVGFRAERSPAMGDLLQKEGHELGCHTNMHRNAWRSWPWTAARDVNEGYRRMSRWMPASAAFRPPFGKLTIWSWLAAWSRGAPICWWTCDGADTHPTLPEPSTVVERLARDGGGVVLMHSHDRGEDRHRYVLKLTEMLLQEARRRNWTVCTMAELTRPAFARHGAIDARRA